MNKEEEEARKAAIAEDYRRRCAEAAKRNDRSCWLWPDSPHCPRAARRHPDFLREHMGGRQGPP